MVVCREAGKNVNAGRMSCDSGRTTGANLTHGRNRDAARSIMNRFLAERLAMGTLDVGRQNSVARQIFMQRRRACFFERRLKHHILSAPLAKFAPYSLRRDPIFVLPCFLSILPLMSRWRRSRPRRKVFDILVPHAKKQRLRYADLFRHAAILFLSAPTMAVRIAPAMPPPAI